MSGGMFGIDKGGFSIQPAQPSEPLTLKRIYDSVDTALWRLEEHARIARENATRLTPPAQSVAE